MFDDEMSQVYSKIAMQHMHKHGPWPMMKERVESFLKDGKGSVLDLASGPGQPGIAIGESLPNTHITITDVSEDMLKQANANSAHLSNATVVLADAMNLPFEDNSFDVVTCCYGYMFPESPLKALQETRRVLKPGGVLIATTWDHIDMLPLAQHIMAAVLGEAPTPPPINPMSLSEPGLFESLVTEAGFNTSNMDVSRSTYPFDIGEDADFQYKLCTMMLKAKLDEIEGGHEVARRAFDSGIGKFAVPAYGGCGMMLENNTFKLTVATK
jgi:SAM-dependent methyltransferase